MLTNLSFKTLCQKGENMVFELSVALKAQKFAGGGDEAAGCSMLPVRPVLSAFQERHMG